jgi:ATP-dependent RNA helicase DeaD
LEEEDLKEPLVDLLIAENHNSYDIACAILRMYKETVRASSHTQIDAVDDPNYREPRREKPARKERKGSRQDRGRFERLFMNAGKDKGISQRHIVGTITDKADVKAGAIGKIEIYPNASYIDIRDKEVERVLNAMKGQKVKGIPVVIDRAKPKRRK